MSRRRNRCDRANRRFKRWAWICSALLIPELNEDAWRVVFADIQLAQGTRRFQPFLSEIQVQDPLPVTVLLGPKNSPWYQDHRVYWSFATMDGMVDVPIIMAPRRPYLRTGDKFSHFGLKCLVVETRSDMLLGVPLECVDMDR